MHNKQEHGQLMPLKYMNTPNFVVCVTAELPHNLFIISQPLILLSRKEKFTQRSNYVYVWTMLYAYRYAISPRSVVFVDCCDISVLVCVCVCVEWDW